MTKFKKWWLNLFGYKYVLNTRSREVHLLDSTNKACGIEKMADHNKMYISERKFQKMLKSGEVNGCRFCMKDKDND